MNIKDLPIFVISLPEATERQRITKAHLAEHGLDFTLIEAVDGRGFDVANHPAHDTLRRRLFFGRDLKGGEIGCTLSNKKCYEIIVAQNIPLALIFEDDVVLDKNFIEILQLSLKHTTHFDLLRFISKPKLLEKPHKKLIPLTVQNGKTYHITKTHGIPGGSYAYLITLSGAKKLLKALEKPAYLPIDAIMGQTWLTGLRSLMLLPSPVNVRPEFDSFIGNERFTKEKPKGLIRAAYPLTRLGYKLYENGMRWWQYWF